MIWWLSSWWLLLTFTINYGRVLVLTTKNMSMVIGMITIIKEENGSLTVQPIAMHGFEPILSNLSVSIDGNPLMSENMPIIDHNNGIMEKIAQDMASFDFRDGCARCRVGLPTHRH